MCGFVLYREYTLGRKKPTGDDDKAVFAETGLPAGDDRDMGKR